MSTQPDRAELINEIEAVAAGLSHRPRLKDMREEGAYSAYCYYDEFTSWSEALEMAGYDPDTAVKGKITKEKLSTDIQRVADEIGRPPSSNEYVNNGQHSTSVVYRIFDSWNDALEAAGLECLNFKKVTQITDKQELIDALREDIQRLGHVPNRNELNKKGTYTDTTYQNHFGGYNTALKTAGFPVNQRDNTLKEIECFGCGSTIQKPEWKIEDRDNLFCSQDCLHQATIDTFCDHCGAETEAYYMTHWKRDKRAFCDYSCRLEYYRVSDHNTVKKNCTNCGIQFQHPVYKTDQENIFCTRECGHEFRTLSEEKLIEDLHKAYEKLPDETGLAEIAAETGHYTGPYYRVFDSLHDAAEAAGLDVPYGRTTVECENCTNSFETRKKRARNGRRSFCNRECYFNWMRQGNLREDDKKRVPDYGPSWESQRQAARERDDFTCQSCGMTKEEHVEQYKVRPHVHHISPWHQFDDHKERNRLQNLIVLCVDCHATWEKLPVNPQLPSQ